VNRVRLFTRFVTGSVRLLSVLPEELPAAIDKLQATARAQQKAQDGLFERLAGYEAIALAAKGQKVGGVMLVAESLGLGSCMIGSIAPMIKKGGDQIKKKYGIDLKS
jgi:nitroreductase